MIGKNLKRLRTDYNITQKELADYLGVTPKAVSFYELDQRMPPPELILKIADRFNVTIDFLFGYEKDKITLATLSPTEVGAELQAVLAERDILPAELDKLANVKTGTTAKIIKGTYEPHFDVATKLASVLDVPTSLLLGVKEDTQAIQRQKLRTRLYREIPDLIPTDDEITEIINYIHFLISKRKK